MFLFVLLSVFVIGMNSCNEKGKAKKVYTTDNLIGTRELAWTKTYSREVKFLGDIVPTDDYGYRGRNAYYDFKR